MSRESLTAAQRRWYEVLFLVFGLVGVALIGVAAYRTNLERAHFVVPRVWPTYVPDAFVINSKLAVNVDLKNVGKSPAANIQDWRHTYIQGDGSLTSQEDVVESFKKWIATNPSIGGNTVQSGEVFWVTAQGDILSPEDRQNIMSGRRAVYVLVNMHFTDDFGGHEYHFCQFLSPPQGGGGTMIWNFCSPYNDEH